MSRSDHAPILSFRRHSSSAAIGCVLGLVLSLGAGCRFASNPSDGVVVVADAGAREPSETDEDSRPTPTTTSIGTKATTALDAEVAIAAGEEPADAAVSSGDQDAGEPAATAPASAGSSAAAARPSAPATPASAGSSAPAARPSAPATPAGAGSSAPAAAGSSAPATPIAGAPSAGSVALPTTPPPPAAGNLAPPTQSPKEAECSADLANCLLREPLGYAECLRANQDNGCPEPNTGVSTTSPVTTEDGKPLSQACQAELANCIARLPTAENAASCTEKARKCK